MTSLRIACLIAALVAAPLAAEPDARIAGIFLTWQSDPTTTIAIDWHTAPEEEGAMSALDYRELGEERWPGEEITGVFTDKRAASCPMSAWT